MRNGDNIVEMSTRRPVTVHLLTYGNSKVAVIKVVKDEFDLGLAVAKALVESAPCEVGTYPTKTAAERLKAELESAGATVNLC